MTKYRIYMVIGILAMFLNACKDQTDVYEEYVIPGGRIYPGKVVEAVVHSGDERVVINATQPIDPKVKEIRVFWNFYQDSVSYTVDANADMVEIEVPNLAEGSYSFVIRSYDDAGNVSVPVEVFGISYGDTYKSAITNRPLLSFSKIGESTLSLEFGNASISNGAFDTWVKYTNTDGEEAIAKIPVTEDSYLIEDFGSSPSYATRFVPDETSVDTFVTDYEVIGGAFKIDNSSWTVVEYSSQHSDGENAATNFIDGDPTTRWHSLSGGSSYPHYIVVDMGLVNMVRKFELFRWTGSSTGSDERGPEEFTFELSLDGVTWTLFGPYQFNRFTDDGQVWEITPTQARYFRYTATKCADGQREDRHVMGDISLYDEM